MKALFHIIIILSLLGGHSIGCFGMGHHTVGHDSIFLQYDTRKDSLGKNTNNNAAFVLIDKESMTLSVIDYDGNDLYKFPIACGANYGNKIRPGDKKTPEGIFRIKGVQNAQSWTHDFGDGKGDVKGAYGPWFIRIDVPGHSGIGIHGTHDDGSIGKRVTEGCIRLHNGDVEKIKSVVFTGMVVVILPSRNDILAND